MPSTYPPSLSQGLTECTDEPPSTKTSSILVLPPSLLDTLLAHSSSSTRLSALTLLTTSTVTTKPFSRTAFRLLSTHLPHYHSSTDAEFRNITLGQIRALIERLAGSSFAVHRQAQKIRERATKGHHTLTAEEIKHISDLDDQLADSKAFIRWYLSFIRQQLYPGKGFPRVVMALKVLRMWLNSGINVAPPQKRQSETAKSRSAAGPGRKARIGPQGSDLQFPFRVPIFEGDTEEGRDLTRLLLDCLFHSFEDVRADAAEIVKIGLLQRGEGMDAISSEFLSRSFVRMRTSGRERDADGLARVLEIIYEIVATQGNFTVSGDMLGENGRVVPSVTLSTPLQYVNWLVDDVLENKFLSRIKACGIAEGVKGWASHGIVSGLRLIFERSDIYGLICREGNPELGDWIALHKRLKLCCTSIWLISRSALCESAPEGYIPLDGDADGEDDEADDYELVGSGGDNATQSLMSYSWRAVKESSSLLATITTRAPYPTVILDDDIFASAHLLLDQLTSIRHSGAFSAVSPCFVRVCKRCFDSQEPELNTLPRALLLDAFTVITTKAASITRRSGGIPYLIIGILAAETDPKRPLLQEAFQKFVEIATTTPAKVTFEKSDEVVGAGGNKLDLPQVHALNCIKLLFTDSRLGASVLDLIGVGLEVSVGCFADPLWSVRNAGLMLYTALLNRLFGTRKSRNDYSFTARLYTTERFFNKFPTVREVLLSHLKVGVTGLSSLAEGGLSNTTPGVEMVYPALSLLARLGVSPDYQEMEGFKPLILECMRCQIWRVREVAAKAYVTLVSPKECICELRELLDFRDKAVWKQNTVHGNLCAVRYILERRKGEYVEAGKQDGSDGIGRLRGIVSEIVSILEGCFDALVTENDCLLTRALYLEIIGVVALNLDDSFTGSLGVNSSGTPPHPSIELSLT